MALKMFDGQKLRIMYDDIEERREDYLVLKHVIPVEWTNPNAGKLLHLTSRVAQASLAYCCSSSSIC